MLQLLLRHGAKAEASIGHLAFGLAQLASAGIEITPTAVVSGDAFTAYLDGRWDGHPIQEILDELGRDFSSHGLLVRASLPDDAVFCQPDLTVARSPTALANAVERIYRSMTTPRSRASRIACGLSDEELSQLPALTYHNSRFRVLFRGQDEDYTVNHKGDPVAGSSLYPSILRSTGQKDRTDELNRRFALLARAEEKLKERLADTEIHRDRIVRWAILQHYEIVTTPPLDVRSRNIRKPDPFRFQALAA
jgi:hypothetical protein